MSIVPYVVVGAILVVAAVIMAVIHRNRGTHQHKCQGCHTVWRHADACAGDVAAHTCKKCGRQEWPMYR